MRTAEEDGAGAVAVHFSKLQFRNMSTTIKAAKKMVEREEPRWDILEEVIREHPVPLNRAPTFALVGHPGCLRTDL